MEFNVFVRMVTIGLEVVNVWVFLPVEITKFFKGLNVFVGMAMKEIQGEYAYRKEFLHANPTKFFYPMESVHAREDLSK